MELEYADPVLYWRRRAKAALESQGVIVPPHPRRDPVPRRAGAVAGAGAVAHVRKRNERVGLDLICRSCERDVPKSTTLLITCDFYSPDGPIGSPLTRCYIRCPHCSNNLVLGRSIGDEDNFVVVEGAVHHFPAVGDSNTEPHDLQIEVSYPDSVLDSPNDVQPEPPRVREPSPEELRLFMMRRMQELNAQPDPDGALNARIIVRNPRSRRIGVIRRT